MNNDLISRKAAIEQCKRHDDYTAWSIADGIEALPTIEAEPKRGRWIKTSGSMTNFKCDNPKCGAPSFVAWNYCHNCGAKMDLEVEE